MIYVAYGLIIFLFFFILYHLVWFLHFKKRFVPVLMYHRITSDVKAKGVRYKMHKGAMLDLDSMKVKPDVFDEQMAYLHSKGFITEQLTLKSIRKKVKQVFITFDDGYYDNFEVALPILNKYNLKAIFFLTAGLIEKKEFMPIDQNDKRKINRLMDWSDAKKLVASGMQLGGHTMSHNWLTNEDIDLESEIVDSKILIEARTKVSVDVFAYPAGLYNDKVLEKVKEHYICALITSRGSDIKYSNNDPYLIERETISSTDSMFMFKLKLYGVHRFLRKLPWLNELRKVIRWIKSLKH